MREGCFVGGVRGVGAREGRRRSVGCVSAKPRSGATGEAALRRRVGPAPASRRDGSGAKPDFAPEQGQSRSGASRRGVAPERLRSGAVSVPLRSGGRRGSGAEGDAGGRASALRRVSRGWLRREGGAAPGRARFSAGDAGGSGARARWRRRETSWLKARRGDGPVHHWPPVCN